MEDFITFFGELIVVIAVSGLFYAMAPDGGQKKYVQFAISLCILAALIGPMLSVVAALPDILEEAEWDVKEEETAAEEELTDAVIEESRKNIEEAILQLLLAKYDLEKDALTVSVSLDAGNPASIEILSVTVKAKGTTHLERQNIKTYLAEQMLERCEIRVEE